ncbi:MAG: hypothetical protein ACI9CO_000553 [Candidatus Azotimanducaceae bacterium]|jgi:hypothetical protein
MVFFLEGRFNLKIDERQIQVFFELLEVGVK